MVGSSLDAHRESPGHPSYDLVVVGGGSAGLTAAIMAGRLGARTLLVDRERLGGDCTHHGCVPSKALIHCARLAHHIEGSSRFGIEASSRVDWSGVKAHIQRAIDRVAAHETPEALAAHGIEVAFGGARFADGPSQLVVGGERVVTARRVVLCVGSRSAPPPIPGLAEAGFIDHRDVFRLDALPKRLAVIGGGPIGVELGQALARLGVKVTIVQRGPRILPRDDDELTNMLADRLRAELDVVTDAEVLSCERDGDDHVVRWERDGQSQLLRCDAILVATGRVANVEGLELERAGVALRDGRIAVDPYVRTSARGVYAAGDCAGPHAFTHFASAQARIATRNALFRFPQRFQPAAVPWCTFTDPELAQVGTTEAQATQSGEDIRIYRRDYQHVDRAVSEASTGASPRRSAGAMDACWAPRSWAPRRVRPSCRSSRQSRKG